MKFEEYYHMAPFRYWDEVIEMIEVWKAEREKLIEALTLIAHHGCHCCTSEDEARAVLKEMKNDTA